MLFGNPLRPPRHLLLLFLVLTLLPALALLWAGWKLIDQDRDLEHQRIQNNRESATELIVTALQQKIEATQQQLMDPAAWLSTRAEDAFILVVEPENVQTFPPTPLLYYPVEPPLPEAPDELFIAADGNEMARLRELTKSRDPSVRAGADLRLAMKLRNSNQAAAALEVYADLEKQTGVAVADNPADLVARVARCGLLAGLNRGDELRVEAEQLDVDLHNSRWQLDHGSYEADASEVDSWLGRTSTAMIAMSERESLSHSLEDLWAKMQDNHAPDNRSGSQQVFSGSHPSALVWRHIGDRLTVLVAGPNYVKKTWLSGLDPLLKDQELRLSLQAADELGVSNDSDHNDLTTIRKASETHLPWTLQVESLASELDRFQTAKRQRLYLAGLALLMAVVVAGSYFIGRSVTRELAVAQLQSDFVAAVSHEFRTPLTSLRQVTELLSDGRKPDPERLPSYYAAQTRATDRLQRLVESLLDFGKMEAGAKAYRMQRLEVSNWARSVVEDFQADMPGDYRIDLTMHCDNGATAAVEADPEALARALRNLIENALKYSPECRTVWVDLSRSGKNIAISVRDQGLGIPSNEKKTIFQKFVRGAASKSNGIKGTGVGLAMVQQIVGAHGGTVRLESEPGAGSTFTILLPSLPVGAVYDRARPGTRGTAD